MCVYVCGRRVADAIIKMRALSFSVGSAMCVYACVCMYIYVFGVADAITKIYTKP